LALALVVFFAIPAAASAQAVDAWLAKAANAKTYGALAEDLKEFAAELKMLSLDDKILATRLEEAAKKKVSPKLLLATLEEDMDRYRLAVRELRSRDLLSSNKREATSMVEEAAILLRAGLDQQELGAVLDASLEKLGAKAKQTDVVARAFSALSVVVSVNSKYRLDEDERLLVAESLVASDLSEKKFGSILDSIEDLIDEGASIETAFEEALSTLEKGKNDAAKSEKSNNPEKNDKSDKEPPGQEFDRGNPQNQDTPGKK